MRNKKLIIAWISILVLLIIAGVSAYAWERHTFASSNKAIAVVQHGEVLVSQPDGTMQAFTGQIELLPGQTLQTLDGEALLTINSDFFIWLRTNSQLTLQTLNASDIDVKLTDGAAWYMHVNASAPQQFTLYTPLDTITPYGTKFYVTYDANTKETSTILVQGSATVSDEFGRIYLTPVEKAYKTDINGLRLVGLTPDDMDIVQSQLKKDYAILTDARMQEINKYGVALNIIKSKYNVTDDDIKYILNQVDTGKISEDDLIKQSPVPLPNLDRIRAITDEAKSTLQVQQSIDQQNQQVSASSN